MATADHSHATLHTTLTPGAGMGAGKQQVYGIEIEPVQALQVLAAAGQKASA